MEDAGVVGGSMEFLGNSWDRRHQRECWAMMLEAKVGLFSCPISKGVIPWFIET
jgi:hypothetical protein